MSVYFSQVIGYGTKYIISNHGIVYSVKRRKVIRPTNHRCGYLQIKLYKNGKPKMHYVQRLVAECFVSNPMGKPFVNHIDGNKKNNVYTNLEWVTGSENTYHSFAKGLQKPLKLGDHPLARLVINMETGIFYETMKQAADSINMNPGTLRAILNGKNLNKTPLKLA